MAIALDWYNLNAARHYPLDTAATGDSDAGENIPAAVLVDCHLRFPNTIGQYAYISSLYSSENLVSITFLASDLPAIPSDCDSDSSQQPGTFVPLAAVSVTADEFVPDRQIAISPLYPGVGGWIVLGHNAFRTNYSGRFSTVQQGMLAPRVARAYQPLPITSMAKLHHNTELTGLVLLKAGNDIEIVKDQRLINGQWRDAMIIRLSNIADQDVIAKYIGPCGGRPESNSCLKPAIESINSVKPDCDGNIKLSFTTTCVYPGYEEGIKEGMVIDYCMGLKDACVKDRYLPKDGVLPHTYRDDCEEPEEPSESFSSEPLPPLPSSAQPLSSSSEIIVCDPLPHTEDFSSSSAAGFYVRSGSFEKTNGFYNSSNGGARNIAEWLDCAYDNCIDKNVEIELRLRSDGSLANGGIILGYAANSTVLGFPSSPTPLFLLVEIDKPTDSFRVMFWTGAGMVELAKAGPIGLLYNHVYKIRVETSDAGSGSTNVTAKLYEYTSLLATIGLNTTILNRTAENSFGLHANQAITSFCSFYVEDA